LDTGTGPSATIEPLEAPVLFILFNRPETTFRVFEAIRGARPRRLFVAGDGPRPNRPGEKERCETARTVLRKIDWDCEVSTLFRDHNVGLKKAVSSAVDWFFEQVPEGIILEDDCLPTASFFGFCQDLLARHRMDSRVMGITGDNFQDGRRYGNATYYYSRLCTVWGWATWRRAWQHFDLAMTTFPQFRREKRIRSLFPDPAVQEFWMEKMQDVYDGGTSWSFAWVHAMLAQDGLCATPNVNLVSNIGFGPGAVHATATDSQFANIPRHEIDVMVHPSFVEPDTAADAYFSRNLSVEQGAKRSGTARVKRALRRLLGPRACERLRGLRQGGGRV
jgi:hypothetical protein